MVLVTTRVLPVMVTTCSHFMLCSKRKIEDFLNTLEAFRMTVNIVTKLQGSAPNFRWIYLSVFAVAACCCGLVG